MANILLLKKHFVDNSPVVEAVDMEEEDIYRFVQNFSLTQRVYPEDGFYLVDREIFSTDAKEVCCSILTDKEENYMRLRIFPLH